MGSFEPQWPQNLIRAFRRDYAATSPAPLYAGNVYTVGAPLKAKCPML
jgi:hypothetical protein